MAEHECMLYAISINGLPLPAGLLTLMNEGRWKFPDDAWKMDCIFPVRGSDAMLYTLEFMLLTNVHWYDEQLFMWLGVPTTVELLGNITPKLSILIGDLGNGSDQPIALDYRDSMDTPRVLALEWSLEARGVNPDWGNWWIEVAPDIEAFAQLLGL